MSKIQRLRDQLYLLQGSRCFYCDKGIAPDDRSLEHIIPSCDGGLADCDNAVVVCEAANQLLGSATPKQKIIMLKAGGGKIECPKKCPKKCGEHTGAGNYDNVLIPPNAQKQARAHMHQTNLTRAQANKPAAKVAPPSEAEAVGPVAQSEANSQTPMTAKQKHKARSGHQSMPRPASGRRRR